MRERNGRGQHACMTKFRTPLDAASAVLQNPRLPAGDDERFAGFGVLGLPFASGHYLALRCIPAASFAPGYRSVWQPDPAGVWTFYATAPGPQSCARYFSSATSNDAVQCDIDVAWVNPWSLFVGIAGLLESAAEVPEVGRGAEQIAVRLKHVDRRYCERRSPHHLDTLISRSVAPASAASNIS